MTEADYLEIDDELHYYYRATWGGITPFFRSVRDERRLLVTRCASCGTAYCPPRTICPDCWSPTHWEPHGGEGEVVAPVYCYWTQSNSPTRSLAQLPFVYGLVRLDGVSSCLHSLIHSHDMRLNATVQVGTRVRVCFREVRRGHPTDFYFMPLEELDGDGPERRRSG